MARASVAVVTTSTVASTVAVMHHDHGMVNRRGSEVAISGRLTYGEKKNSDVASLQCLSSRHRWHQPIENVISPPLALVNAQ